MSDLAREKICFYTPLIRGDNSMRRIIDLAAKHGMRGIEMINFCDELRTPDKSAALELFQKAKLAGLDIPCFSVGVTIVGEHASNGMNTLKQYAEIAARMEIPYFHHTVALSVKPDAYQHYDFESLFLQGVENAMQAAELCRKLGMISLVENQGRIFNGIANYQRFLEGTKGNVGFLLDIGNSLFVDDSPISFVQEIGAPIHVHLKDYKLCQNPVGCKYSTLHGRGLCDARIGEGDANVSTVLQMLRQLHYQGLFSLEAAALESESQLISLLDSLERLLEPSLS